MKDDIQETERRLKKFLNLVKLNAPACIKAHYLVAVLIPDVVRNAKIIDEFALELGTMLARGLAAHSGMCRMCRKVYSHPSETCPKCTAELDQIDAQVNEDLGKSQ